MVETRVARRYAQTLLDLSLQEGKLDVAFNDMNFFVSVYKQSKDFSAVLKSPVITADKKLPILNKIFKGRINDLTLSFIELVTRKNREEVLIEVANEFSALYFEHKNIAKATVISAIELPEASVSAIKSKLEAFTGKGIVIETAVDKSIIGGVVVKIGDKIIDKSVKNMLNRLKLNFNGASLIAN